MSHFTTIKTKIKEKEYLIKALEKLNIKFKQGSNLKCRGYNGQTTQVEVLIPTSNVGYDLGFAKKGDNYVLVGDWYGIENINKQDFLNNITQQYSYFLIKDNLDEKGYTFLEETTDENQTIQITLRKTVW